MIYDVGLDGISVKVTVERAGTRYRVTVGDGPPREIDAARPVPDVLSLLVDRKSWECGLVPTEEGFDVDVLGIRHPVRVQDPRRASLRLSAGVGVGTVRTAMPGRVTRLLVEEGDAVGKGQALVVVEAMKMENELKSPREGVVRRIAVKAGALVEAGETLVELE